ncbi:phage tail tape measure protein, TP901 family, core region [Azotobacter beijerinckii]|uniref:Phage tail tape measure protein, TP901 family, core region n=1 Tax=Azotobacter beijerinckii TaxID=170623 RepID=A0A1H6TST5_9GAMM|nr:phage tail tape measure protein [Azotobacter beijerinckii]SEI83081.1 phage tail tape measure protein, TP901 family, core region [Azotobacter beijerinckii]
MARDLKLQVLLSAVDKITAPLRRIAQGSGAVAQALKASREQLKQLNAQQRDVSSFRTLKSASQETATALAASQARVRELAQAVAAAEAPSRKLSAEFKRAQREAQALKQKHGEQQRELQGLRGRLGEAGISTRNLGNHERELRQRIADTNRTINQHTERLRRATEQQQSLAKAQEAYNRAQNIAGKLAVGGASMAATGAVVGAPILSIVKDYAAFEDAMLGVAKQVEGARDANGQLTATYYEMGAGIKEMATRIPMATTEIAALVEAGARMGIQGKENLLRFAETTAIAATAFDLPVEEVGDNMGKIANLYKIPIENIGQLGDTINWLDDSALSKGGDIIDVMQRMAGIATSAGMSFKEAAALGSTFLTMGSTSEVAGTAANAMIRELSIAEMQSKSFQKGLGMLGLNAATIQKSMSKDATGTIIKTLEAIKKLAPEKQMTASTLLFGKEYGDDAAKLANNLDEYRRQLQLVNAEQAKGSMLRESDAKNQNLSARWMMLQNKLFNQSSALGASMAQPLIELMDTVGGMVDRVTAWTKANPELTATLVKAAALVSALAIGGGTLALILAGLVGPLAMAKLGMATFGITTSAALGPVLLIIGAVAVLAAGAYLVWQNWGTLGPKFAALWEGIKSQFGSLMTWFAGLPERFKQFGADILQGLANGITGAFGSVKEAITGAGGAAIDWFKEKLGIHSPSRVFSQLGEYTMQGLEQGIGAAMSGPLEAIQEVSKSLASEAAKAMELTLPTDAVESPTQNVLLNIENMQVSLIGISRLFAQFGTAIRAVGSALMMLAASPVALVIAGIAAAIGGAAYLIWNNWGTLGPKFAVLWEGIKVQFGSLMTWFASLPERFRQFGADILQGLASGITGALGSVKEAITGAGGAAIGWFKEKLGIHSPSRVFAQLGGYTMQGLEQGLVAGQGGPLGAIAGLGKQLAQAGALAVGVGGAGSALAIDNRPPLAASASAPIIVQGDTITIHVSAAGGQANDLAQQINRILDERERAKAARVRSRLHDQE